MKIKLNKVPKSLEEIVKKLPDEILGVEIIKPKRQMKKVLIPIVLGSAVVLAYSISRVGGKVKEDIENLNG